MTSVSSVVAAPSPPSQHLEDWFPAFTDAMVCIFLGGIVIWLVAVAAKQVWAHFQPVVIPVILMIIVGVLASHAIN